MLPPAPAAVNGVLEPAELLGGPGQLSPDPAPWRALDRPHYWRLSSISTEKVSSGVANSRRPVPPVLPVPRPADLRRRRDEPEERLCFFLVKNGRDPSKSVTRSRGARIWRRGEGVRAAHAELGYPSGPRNPPSPNFAGPPNQGHEAGVANSVFGVLRRTRRGSQFTARGPR
jgi:hypothetical protein